MSGTHLVLKVYKDQKHKLAAGKEDLRCGVLIFISSVMAATVMTLHVYIHKCVRKMRYFIFDL